MAVLWSLSFLQLLHISAANAQVSPLKSTSQTAAQALFDEGRRLMGDGHFDEACPKLEESQRLDPGGGTLLNLALCHEQQGRTATAWAEFNEALSAALRDGRDVRVKMAREHIAALEPQLSRVVVVPENSAAVAEYMEVRIDGTPVGRAAWGIPTPVDPGKHNVTASASGYLEWSTTIEVAGSAQTSDVRIPMLVKAPPASPVNERMGRGQKTPESPIRTGALVSFGVAAGGLATGSVFGVLALLNRQKSTGECPTDATCSAQGVEWNRTAITQSWISTAAFGVGVLGAGVGTYLLVRNVEPRTLSATQTAGVVRLGPYVSSSQAGISVAGAF